MKLRNIYRYINSLSQENHHHNFHKQLTVHSISAQRQLNLFKIIPISARGVGCKCWQIIKKSFIDFLNCLDLSAISHASEERKEIKIILQMNFNQFFMFSLIPALNASSSHLLNAIPVSLIPKVPFSIN